MFDNFIPHGINEVKLTITDRCVQMQAEIALSMGDLTKLVVTGEQPTNQSKNPNPPVTFLVADTFLCNTVTVNYVEIKCTAVIINQAIAITLIDVFHKVSADTIPH